MAKMSRAFPCAAHCMLKRRFTADHCHDAGAKTLFPYTTGQGVCRFRMTVGACLTYLPKAGASQCPARGDFHPHSALMATPLERPTDRKVIRLSESCAVGISILPRLNYILVDNAPPESATPGMKKAGTTSMSFLLHPPTALSVCSALASTAYARC